MQVDTSSQWRRVYRQTSDVDDVLYIDRRVLRFHHEIGARTRPVTYPSSFPLHLQISDKSHI